MNLLLEKEGVVVMRKIFLVCKWTLSCSVAALLISCSHMQPGDPGYGGYADNSRFDVDYASRLPAEMNTGGKKLVLVDPNSHAWGAYSEDGHLIRAGLATAGGRVCPPDEDAPDCRTSRGTFHITAMKGGECASKVYPRPHGGGLMPYCMFFSGGQALHGAPDPLVVAQNVSHGCVRMRISDAEWMQHNFAQVGTAVKVLPYQE
jgi:hypothetical protein